MTTRNSSATSEIIDYIILLIVCAIVLYMVFLALVNSSFGIENTSTISLFEVDGAFAVRQIQINLAMNELDPWGHYNYGNIYNSIGFVLLKIAAVLGYNVYQVPFIAYTLRFISIVAYVLMLLVFFVTARKLHIPLGLSAVFTLFLGSFPKLYYHAQLIHPDLLTLLFMACAVLMIVLKQDGFGLLLGTLFAGLAFGTKYTGVFILPFLPIPYCYGILRGKQTLAAKIIKIFATGVGVIIVFLLTWLLTNPSVLENYKEVIVDISFERFHLTEMHRDALGTQPLSWLAVLYGEFSWTGSIVIIAGLLCGIVSLVFMLKTKFRDVINILTLKNSCSHQSILISFIFLYTTVGLAYFFLKISFRSTRYIFHVLPGLLLLSGLGFRWLYKTYFPSKWQMFSSWVLLGLIIPVSVHAVNVNSFLSKKYENDFIVAGKWLIRNYPPSVRILYELHGHIPQDYFQNFQIAEYITAEAIEAFSPDVVIFKQPTSGRWSQRKRGAVVTNANLPHPPTKKSVQEIIAFRNTFFAPDNTEWRIVYEAESLVILEKQSRNP